VKVSGSEKTVCESEADVDETRGRAISARYLREDGACLSAKI